MIKLSTRVFTTLILLQTTHLMAMEPYEEDIESSKKNFLISQAIYSENDKTKGAMTLCFKTIRTTLGFEYEHAALVFEIFVPTDPDNVFLSMIHYGGDPDCCGCGINKKPVIESKADTLIKVYRGFQIRSTGQKQYFHATYKRYAGWRLLNEDLLKGYRLAEIDKDAHSRDMKLCDSYSCISYVQRIMQAVGLSNVDFGGWMERAGNLKCLVSEYVKPQPNFQKYDTIPLRVIRPDICENIRPIANKTLVVQNSNDEAIVNPYQSNVSANPPLANQQNEIPVNMGVYDSPSVTQGPIVTTDQNQENRSAATIESTIPTSETTQVSNDANVARRLNETIQRDEERPIVTGPDYQGIADIGVFDDPSAEGATVQNRAAAEVIIDDQIRNDKLFAQTLHDAEVKKASFVNSIRGAVAFVGSLINSSETTEVKSTAVEREGTTQNLLDSFLEDYVKVEDSEKLNGGKK